MVGRSNAMVVTGTGQSGAEVTAHIFYTAQTGFDVRYVKMYPDTIADDKCEGY